MNDQALSNKWISLFVNGLIALFFGSIFIFIPETVYITIIGVFGGLVLLLGLGFIYFGVKQGKSPGGKQRMMWIVQGIINIGIGIFMIMQPELLFKFIMTFVGIWLIIAGAIQLYDSHVMRNVMSSYRLLLLWGFVNIALGLIVILWKEFPIVVFGYFAYFIALIMFIYAGIFYKYRNVNPNQTEIEAEDADIIEETKIEEK